MYCDECHIRPVAVKIQIAGQGQAVERALCQQCGQKYGAFQSAPLAAPWPFALLNGMMAPAPLSPTLPGPTRCLRFGYPFIQFQQTGMLGCPECYTSFRPQMEIILRRSQGGSVRHGGKTPTRGGGTHKLRCLIEALRVDLEQAVKDQRFEDAVRLRDEIRAREKELSDDTAHA